MRGSTTLCKDNRLVDSLGRSGWKDWDVPTAFSTTRQHAPQSMVLGAPPWET